MCAGRVGECLMEVIHSIEGAYGKFQFLQDGDKYAVVWDIDRPNIWFPRDVMIEWSLMPTVSDTFREMDKFILNYFPESLVTLVALGKS